MPKHLYDPISIPTYPAQKTQSCYKPRQSEQYVIDPVEKVKPRSELYLFFHEAGIEERKQMEA